MAVHPVLRFVAIATDRSQAERPVRSLRKVHPTATITLHVDEPACFAHLAPSAEVVPFEHIDRWGIKQAKFLMYREAATAGPLVYLDCDIVVLESLEEVLVPSLRRHQRCRRAPARRTVRRHRGDRTCQSRN